MRIVTYRSGGGDRAGVQVEGGTVDAAELLGAEPASVRELIAEDRLGTLATGIA